MYTLILWSPGTSEHHVPINNLEFAKKMAKALSCKYEYIEIK